MFKLAKSRVYYRTNPNCHWLVVELKQILYIDDFKIWEKRAGM